MHYVRQPPVRSDDTIGGSTPNPKVELRCAKPSFPNVVGTLEARRIFLNVASFPTTYLADCPRRETPPTMANLLKDLLGGGSKSSASPIPSADSGMRTRHSIDFLKPSIRAPHELVLS